MGPRPQVYCWLSMRCDSSFAYKWVAGVLGWTVASPQPIWTVVVHVEPSWSTSHAYRSLSGHSSHHVPRCSPDRIDDAAAEDSRHSSLQGIISNSGLQLGFRFLKPTL